MGKRTFMRSTLRIFLFKCVLFWIELMLHILQLIVPLSSRSHSKVIFLDRLIPYARRLEER